MPSGVQQLRGVIEGRSPTGGQLEGVNSRTQFFEKKRSFKEDVDEAV